jgi:hypothetical protein
MSRLEYLMRPLVAFDPTNKDHRRYYAEFLETGGWGRCPVRFIVPEDNVGVDLPAMIKNRLVDYYVSREFGGTELSRARAEEMSKSADQMYRHAGKLRKEAQALLKPRRN